MSAEIWKFKLRPTDNLVTMPAGSRPLSVAFQRDDLRVWAVVQPANSQVRRAFRVVGTGHPAPDLDGAFVGTAHHPSGLVFHVFDYGEQPAT